MKAYKGTKEWETKNGDFIPYEDLKDEYLLNIIRLIEKKAESGITLRAGGGHDMDDVWYTEKIIKGDEVLSFYDYRGLLKEAQKRAVYTKIIMKTYTEFQQRVVALWEKAKKRYPNKEQLEGFEPALTSDILEITEIILEENRTALLTELRDSGLLEERDISAFDNDPFHPIRAYRAGHNTLARAIKAHLSSPDEPVTDK